MRNPGPVSNKKAVEIQIPLPNLVFLKILPPVFLMLATPALYESSCFDDGGWILIKFTRVNMTLTFLTYQISVKCHKKHFKVSRRHEINFLTKLFMSTEKLFLKRLF